MQVPPDALDGVQVRGVLRQDVEDDAIAVLGQIGTHVSAVMEAGVGTDHMNLPVAPQARPQCFEVPDEQDRVATLTLEQTVEQVAIDSFGSV